MKKFRVSGLIAVLFVFAFMSLGSGSDSDSDKKEIVQDGKAEEGSFSGTEEDRAEAGSPSGAETPATDDSGRTGGAVSIEEQVLIETGNLKVTATEYKTDAIWGDGVNLLIENSGETDIGLGVDALIVNDYMITDLFSATVAAGKKANETLTLSGAGLKAAGIENVGKIEIYFHTFDPDTYMTGEKFDCVTIQTSVYDSMDTTPDEGGRELYSGDGIKIIGRYVDEGSFWGTAVLLYIENSSGKNVIVQCEDMSVNGFMVTPFFSAAVYDGKKAIDEITIMSSDLENNGITSVDEIELKFKIMDENFMNSVETDAITFSAK
ncbi:MAG: hypothetical protein NC517_13460 [Firmicutes bacterium]|nr:hypothetical protein [Bacillota bacterium]